MTTTTTKTTTIIIIIIIEVVVVVVVVVIICVIMEIFYLRIIKQLKIITNNLTPEQRIDQPKMFQKQENNYENNESIKIYILMKTFSHLYLKVN